MEAKYKSPTVSVQCFPLYNFQRTFDIHTFNRNIIFKIFYVSAEKNTHFRYYYKCSIIFLYYSVTILNILFEHLRNYVFFSLSQSFMSRLR